MSEGRIRKVYVLDVVTGRDDALPAGDVVSDAYSKWLADQRRWWRADCRTEGTRAPIMLRGSGDVPAAVRTAWQHGRTLEVTTPDGVAVGHDGLVVK